MKSNNKILQNFFYSLRFQFFVMMLITGAIIYSAFHATELISTYTQRTIARQFYVNELKLLIADQYIDSILPLSQTDRENLDYRIEIMTDPGSVYRYVTSGKTDFDKEAVKEFLYLMELAKQAKENVTNQSQLRSIYLDSLSRPTRNVYDLTIAEIIRTITQSAVNSQILLFIIVITLLIVYFILRNLAGKIATVTNTARSLITSQQHLDLTRRLNFESFNEMIDIVENINIFMNRAEAYTGKLINDTHKMIYQIDKMFEGAKGWTLETRLMQNSTERITQKVTTQLTGVNEAAAALEEMERTLDIIFENISRQSSAMAQAGSTLEEMSRQVEGVANITAETSTLAKQLTFVADKGHHAVDSSILSIKDVAEYSSQILKLLQLISGIAKQTNLLAMNASIEAAHAGDAGRGFAIVAEEIRRLAETTNKNAREIRTVVSTMVEKIDNSVHQAQTAGEDLLQITKYAENVSDSVTRLDSMMQEQNTATHEILGTIENLVILAQEIKLSMEEQQYGLREYSTTIMDLRDNFHELRSSLDGHMSSVQSLLVILEDTGIRIHIQKTTVDNIRTLLNFYEISEDKKISIREMQEEQDQNFLEVKEKSK